MSFAVGSMLRFVARFKSLGIARDPHEVTADVSINGSSKKYTTTNGGVRRQAEGVYTIDVLIDQVGELVVRFNGDAGFGEVAYDVAPAAQRVEAGGVVTSRTPSMPIHDDVDEYADAARAELAEVERLERVAVLEDAGIVTEGRSDAFIEGAYAQEMSKRGQSPSETHAEMQRNAWRGRS